MTAPEVILGASLLTLWVAIGLGRGLPTILVAHIMFNISYVVVTVRARLIGFNRSLEEAGMDLYATESTTFWKVTFPLIFPGIMAAAVPRLLAVDRRLRDHLVRLRHDQHLSHLGLLRTEERAAPTDQRGGFADAS